MSNQPNLSDLSGPDKARLKWLLMARKDQLTPAPKLDSHGEDWLFWLILAGRGWGKTRVGAEDCADWCYKHPNHRFGIVAPTLGNGKKVCLEGESGLLSVLPEGTYKYNRADLVIILNNGCRIDLFSADQPERLRGPQHHRMWFEELAAWGPKMKEVWDMAMFGLRLPLADGMPNQAVITTTPKPAPLIRDLARRDTVFITRGNTFDNAANLSRATLEELRRSYEGTRLGQQELYGVLLDDVEGALWSVMLIENDRFRADDMEELDLDIFDKICVSIDPAVTNSEESDETGIIVAGKTYLCPCGRSSEDEPHVIILEDGSGRQSSHEWTARAIDLTEKYAAEEIVAEVNNGGDLVENVLMAARAKQQLSQGVRYRSVRASRGKRTRAEPVGGLYEKHRVHHWGYFGKLEDQMCGWTGAPGEDSPDRVDALVWAVTHLILPQPKQRGRLRA